MLRLVIFDLDNTIVDSDFDFAAIRAEIGTDQPILEYRAAAGEAVAEHGQAVIRGRHVNPVEDRVIAGAAFDGAIGNLVHNAIQAG